VRNHSIDTIDLPTLLQIHSYSKISISSLFNS
jgi:hypothetical protein